MRRPYTRLRFRLRLRNWQRCDGRSLLVRLVGSQMKYRVLIEQDEDGMHVAEVPSLPGCVSQGRTRKEVLDNVCEAMAAYLESLQKHGEAVPPPISEEIIEAQP